MLHSPHIKLRDLPEQPCLLVPNRMNISLLHMIEEHCHARFPLCCLAEREHMPTDDIIEYLSSKQAAGVIFSSAEYEPQELQAQVLQYIQRGYVVLYLPSTPERGAAIGDPLMDAELSGLAVICELGLDIFPLYLGLYSYDDQQLMQDKLPCDQMLGQGHARLSAGGGLAQRLRDAWQEASMMQLDELHQLESQHVGDLIIESLLHHSHASLIDGVNDSIISYDEMIRLLVPLARELRQTHSQCYRLGIILPPGRDAILANLACLITGIVPVNIDTTLSPPEVEAVICEAELTRFITEERYFQKPSSFAWPLERDLIMIGELLERVGSLRQWVWGTVAHLTQSSWLRKRIATIKAGAGEEAMLFFSCDEQRRVHRHSVTHRMLLASRYISQARLPLKAGHTVLSAQPYYEPMGLILGMLYPLLCGCDIVTYPLASALPRLLALGNHYRVDMALCNPALLREMQGEKPPAVPTSSQMTFVCYGDRLPSELQMYYERHWGLRFMHAFYVPGSASLLTMEASSRSMLEQTAHSAAAQQQGSSQHYLSSPLVRMNGYPLLGVALRICDPESEEPIAQSPHQLGMLWVRSSSLISEKAWLRTGHIAYINEDGELCIAGQQHRFSKLQNELVAHEHIEELIYQIFEIATRKPRRLAIISLRAGDDIAEKLILISSIHKTIPTHELITLRYKLMNMGHPACWCPSHIVTMDQIPEYSDGELDYQRVLLYACQKLHITL